MVTCGALWHKNKYRTLFLPRGPRHGRFPHVAWAIEPQITAIYQRFGLNDRQIEIIACATPKRDYYCQSRRGNRLFELGLGPVALAFCAASSKADHAAIDRVLSEFGRDAFVEAWLADRSLLWAADLIPNLTNVEVTPLIVVRLRIRAALLAAACSRRYRSRRRWSGTHQLRSVTIPGTTARTS